MSHDHHHPNQTTSNIIHLNIGGTPFTTTTQTLTNREPNSFLAKLATSPMRKVGNDGRVFVDRCGRRFEGVLNYLRGGVVLGVGEVGLWELKEEAEFYGLEGLKMIVEEKIRRIELEDDMDTRQYHLHLQYCSSLQCSQDNDNNRDSCSGSGSAGSDGSCSWDSVVVSRNSKDQEQRRQEKDNVGGTEGEFQDEFRLDVAF